MDTADWWACSNLRERSTELQFYKLWSSMSVVLHALRFLTELIRMAAQEGGVGGGQEVQGETEHLRCDPNQDINALLFPDKTLAGKKSSTNFFKIMEKTCTLCSRLINSWFVNTRGWSQWVLLPILSWVWIDNGNFPFLSFSFFGSYSFFSSTSPSSLSLSLPLSFVSFSLCYLFFPSSLPCLLRLPENSLDM